MTHIINKNRPAISRARPGLIREYITAAFGVAVLFGLLWLGLVVTP